MPGIDAGALTHQQLLRSMDALMDHQDAVNACVARLLRPLIDEDLSVVFYSERLLQLDTHSGVCDHHAIQFDHFSLV